MTEALLERVRHHPRRHSARWTDEYLFHQLIPYLGNKRRLLPLLAEAIRRTGLKSGTFADLFAGSGVVSRLAKTLGFRVICNDWEPYSEEINSAYVACDRPPRFARLGGIEAVYEQLNRLPGTDGYLATHYCPDRDEAPDVKRERMFFTHANGARLDAMREQIEAWERARQITRRERSVLLASLVYAASYVSNTSGVFKAFHRGWGGRNGTALYRILSQVHLTPPIFYANGNQRHDVFREDARRLVRTQPPVDIAYLDPPYNQHQYGANYHLLNTLVVWDKPPVNRSIRVRGRTVNKSAIRTDWREERRSKYCYRQTATDEFADLIEHLDADYILVSYSTDGLIPMSVVEDLLRRRGELQVLRRPYKRYRVSPTRPSPRSHNTEVVLICRTR